MAVDAYLFIEGIKGESADSNHQGWIEITSASWGVIPTAECNRIHSGGAHRGKVRAQKHIA